MNVEYIDEDGASRDRLRELGVLDTPPEADFDQITAYVADVLDAPMAFIAFLDGDRFWLKSRFGSEWSEIPRHIAFCDHVVRERSAMVVPDMLQDQRFAENKLVVGEAHVRSYAGAPLTTEDGVVLGTLCVLDVRPREFSALQLKALETMSRQVLAQLKLRQQVIRLQKAEAELQRNEERLSLVSEVTNDTIWDWDLVNDTLWWNEGYETLFGHSRADADPSSKSWSDHIHPEDLKWVTAEVKDVIESGGETWSGEYRFFHKNGEAVHVLDRGRVIRDEEGNAIRMVGGITDMSDRKLVEDKLREQATLLDKAHDAILVRDLNHHILYWNEGAERLYGWSSKEVIGHSITNFLYRDLSVFTTGNEMVLRDGEWKGEIEHIRRDGEAIIVECHWTLLRNKRGEPKSILSIMTDVTERKKVEGALRQTQLFTQIASEIGKIGAWNVNLADWSYRVSDEVRAIHELGPDFESAAEDLINLYVPEHRERVSLAFEDCATNGVPFDLELKSLTTKGRVVWVRLIGEAVRDETGTITSVQGALQDIQEWKDAAETLAASEARFQMLADAMPMMVWTSTPDGALDFSNQQFYGYTQVNRGIPVADQWISTVHPDDMPRCVEAWQRAVESGGPYELEFRIRRGSDGMYRWHLVQAVAIRNTSGEIAKWYGTGTDVHETKALQHEATALAERLTTTLESITDAFFTLNHDWEFTYVNAEAERLLERSRGDLIGNRLWDEFPSAVDSTSDREYHRAISEQVTVKFEDWYWPLGKWFEVHAYPSSEGLAVYFRDITQRRKDEEQLRLLETCIARMSDIVLITEAEAEAESSSEPGRGIMFVNDAFERRTGYTREEVMGRDPRFLQGEKTQRDALDRVRDSLADMQPVREELINYTKSGEEYWIEMDIVPVANDEGSYTHFVAMERDVTERKRNEKDLQQANELLEERVAERTTELARTNHDLVAAKEAADAANMAKSEFLSRMSHELRTPMNAILGFSQLLEFSDMDESQRDSVAHILKAGKHLLALINDVLEISRVEIGQIGISLEPVDIADLLDECYSLMRPLADERSITFILETVPKVYVQSDRQKLRQVVLNLVSNAIKYNKEDGRVTIRVAEAGDDVTMTVIDTGIGISDLYLNRIFTPFDRLGHEGATEGTGLGLALSKSLTEAMGGSLTVVSRENVGSEFTVTLRRSHSEPAAAEIEMPRFMRQLNDGVPTKVLVIEDNLTNTELLSRIFSAYPHIRLLMAMQGRMGLDLAHEHQPDVILLDLHLPDINGKEVLAAILADDALRDVPVIIVSADAFSRQSTSLLKAGAFRYITKPFDIPELIQAVDEALTLRRQNDK